MSDPGERRVIPLAGQANGGVAAEEWARLVGALRAPKAPEVLPLSDREGVMLRDSAKDRTWIVRDGFVRDGELVLAKFGEAAATHRVFFPHRAAVPSGPMGLVRFGGPAKQTRPKGHRLPAPRVYRLVGSASHKWSFATLNRQLAEAATLPP